MILVWHRADLRTHDHPALAHAMQHANGHVIPAFVLDPSLLSMPYSGRNRVAFLHANLHALNAAYQRLDSSLILRAGQPEVELTKLARAANATAVYAIQSLEPVGRARDARIKTLLEREGIEFRLFQSDTIQQPGKLRTGTGNPYRVFTPFWRAWTQLDIAKPAPTPTRLEPHGLVSLELPATQSQIDLPPAGEDAAQEMLEHFIRSVGNQYERQRASVKPASALAACVPAA